MNYTLEQIKQVMLAKGYVWFNDDANKSYDVNIIGIRNSSTGSEVTNLFDDTLTIAYKEYGVWKFHQWQATTEPGKKGMLQGKAAGGVAFLVPGQYRGSHAIGLHQGKYEALRQIGELKLYRDGDRDLDFDTDKITECSNCGINIHMAGEDSTFVENWSEGCQVFKRKKDFLQFMEIIKKARLVYGNRFSYTLLESADIFAEHKIVGEKKTAARKAAAKKPTVKKN
jgi:hypothetical protein